MDGATIYALGTPRPSRAHPGALSVIRLSGPRAADVLVFLTEPGAFARGRSAREPALPAPRRMVLRTLYDPLSGEAIDRGLAVWFEAPHTETGETMAELHLHGGRAVVGAALEAIRRLKLCRLAEPGEFTRRAFEHGRLDLTEAEGIADLVAAETEQQRRLALQQMDGALHKLYEAWRKLGLGTLAHLEAAIDFPDEDLPPGLAQGARDGIVRLQAGIGAHLADRRGERLRDGLHIAIIGPPNAGKSSLLNLLARRDAAIVSETAGTTRDVIEVHLDLGGWPVVLADTAGLRESGDAIEQEGVRRARARAAAADLRVLVLDASSDWKTVRQAITASTEGWDPARDLVVVNKMDLAPVEAAGDVAALSASSGQGLSDLLARLERSAGLLMDEGAGAPPLTRARHREALAEAHASLGRALIAPEIALAAEDLRLALRAIGRITGTVRVEELLDVIFRDFCIGK
ncbi:MAG: tRNA uridine-5-carboxymethylaminomethyl(34) synthesis GTPase MnmE [Reyranella sp.]|nr:tRNA uridine-5-carboxymethylaminomethyl(34) synthesis GTPase MnmE [Reyranella sp.]